MPDRQYKPVSLHSDLNVEDISLFDDSKESGRIPELAKVAIGVLTWPIAQLVKPNRFKAHSIRKVITDGDTTAAIEWTVTPSREFGMPTMLSLRLLFAFQKLGWELKETSGRQVEFIPIGSWNSLCSLIGLTPSRYNRSLLKHHLEILHNTAVNTKRAFKTSYGKEGISDNFFLVPSIKYKGTLDTNGAPYEDTYVSLPQALWDSIANKYVKTIDLAFMAELTNEAAQLLSTKVSYLLQSQLSKGQNYGEFDYEWLAEGMGLTIWKDKWRAKQQLEPAFRALVAKQYITVPTWWIDDSWKIRISPGVRFSMGEQLQLQQRKKAVQSKQATNRNRNVFTAAQGTSNLEDARHATLARQAARIMIGAQPDFTALLEQGWTVDDAIQKASELKAKSKPLSNRG